MKITFELNQKTKTIKSDSFCPMAVPVDAKISVVEGKLEIVEIDCSKSGALKEITKFCEMSDERFDIFCNKKVHDINEYDQITKSTLVRYLIVLDNIKNVSEEVKAKIQALWNKTRAAGIYHVFKIASKEDLWEPIKSSNQNIF